MFYKGINIGKRYYFCLVNNMMYFFFKVYVCLGIECL